MKATEIHTCNAQQLVIDDRLVAGRIFVRRLNGYPAATVDLLALILSWRFADIAEDLVVGRRRYLCAEAEFHRMLTNDWRLASMSSPRSSIAPHSVIFGGLGDCLLCWLSARAKIFVGTDAPYYYIALLPLDRMYASFSQELNINHFSHPEAPLVTVHAQMDGSQNSLEIKNGRRGWISSSLPLSFLLLVFRLGHHFGAIAPYFSDLTGYFLGEKILLAFVPPQFTAFDGIFGLTTVLQLGGRYSSYVSLTFRGNIAFLAIYSPQGINSSSRPFSIMPTSLLSAPQELLGNIVLTAVRQTRQGPPCDLLSLLLTCRLSYRSLCFVAHPTLHFLIFAAKFDLSSPRRHLAPDQIFPCHIESELRKRFTALHRIRSGDTNGPWLLEALIVAYTLILEDDGKNWEQLLWAQLPSFIYRLVRQRLTRVPTSSTGWPLEDQVNTLAVAILWLMSSSPMIHEETKAIRDEFIELLGPFVLAAFRYPCSVMPEHEFHPSTLDSNAKAATASTHDPQPTNRLSTIDTLYFNHLVKFRFPSLASYAILAYFSRLETRPMGIPPHLPANRVEANARGIEGPTREDAEHFVTHCKTHFISTAHGDQLGLLTKSQRFDPDLKRTMHVSFGHVPYSKQGSYTPGTLTGRWQGSYVVPCREVYISLRNSPLAPSPFPTFGRSPLYVTFRELYCYSPSSSILSVDNESFMNGFLPLGCRWMELEDGLEIYGQNSSFRSYYEPLRTTRPAECNASDGSGISQASQLDAVDIIITGKTEDRFRDAWGGYSYIGRIRPSDGLIVLLREPLDPLMEMLGRSIFRGYVVGSRNFVGRWRGVAGGAQTPEWEAAFSMCKDTALP
ncbi:hypothetical protein SERLA73DRAFT_70490 [Serpula lacrymans var. lacrymans S7.3]|uniref:F-box domain-containing protein n=2 Tax=Serpula lacrymans var. lacrymans TaxID=341189 RepID=F8PN43_SERL3|nr:uncharacterized protein SERLADRAFT_434612 [Serpula lacrymans var. lacrymans S7.9]EGO03025.1 hypothetical protein SERLA73DRAFT_70490 [Serpula lacrymans var. lacrymans S7.3]EGO28704.1 hypothetical protein SERLADRAFT_434612 [Serpula lacrymans var. lacrymans S7.9]